MERPTVTCYAQRDKLKSMRVLDAFAAGCGGQVSYTDATALQPGAAAFYGVRPAWRHLWRAARTEGRRWYYVDNAWFDVAREQYFRVGIDAMQTYGRASSGGQRLRDLGVQVVERERNDGRHIVICAQSREFMACNADWPDGLDGWMRHVGEQLRRHSDRPVIWRQKGLGPSLPHDLRGAWLLITHASAAAVEALIAGVPVIVTDPRAAAAVFSLQFDDIERAMPPVNVRQWAEQLADSQWTIEELAAGAAWSAMHG